jgi:hypothetical protein
LLVSVHQAAADTTRQRILSFADQQLGYQDHGYYCTKFGPCETWCSLFVTWVWRDAGVPVPSLAFTGDLYYWAKATTSVIGARALPAPGDAVLFGTGPSTVNTSLHTGIVEGVYPGYLVTVEGDSLHAVRRYVVPLRDPQLVGEPGPIYAYASPVSSSGNDRSSPSPAPAATPAALVPEILARPQFAPLPSLERLRLLRAIVALRAFQHMPYHTANVSIDWTGVDSRGLVEVSVGSALPAADARRAWQGFLRRFNDAGNAYTVSFQATLDAPVEGSAPPVSGGAAPGQK